MLEPRHLKEQHYCQLSSLLMEMGRTAKDFGGQYSHDIRGHIFRMQFIQCNNWLDVVHVFAFFWGGGGKNYEDHGTIFLCQTEESATLYKHCNRIWPFSFEDWLHTRVKSLQ